MPDEPTRDAAMGIAEAVRSVAGVARLYDDVPEDGSSSAGAVRLTDDLVEVRIVVRPDADPHLLAERVRRAVRRVVGDRAVALIIEDLEAEDASP